MRIIFIPGMALAGPNLAAAWDGATNADPGRIGWVGQAMTAGWPEVATLLKSQGHTLVTVPRTLAGVTFNGRSEAAIAAQIGRFIEATRAALIATIRAEAAAGERVVVLAHSLGGLLITEDVTAALGECLAGVVFIDASLPPHCEDCAAGFDSAPGRAGQIQWLAARLCARLGKAGAATAPASAPHQTRRWGMDIAQALVENIAYRRLLAENIGRSLDLPGVVIGAGGEGAWIAGQRQFAAAQGARFYQVRGGHLVWSDVPRTLAAIIDSFAKEL